MNLSSQLLSGGRRTASTPSRRGLLNTPGPTRGRMAALAAALVRALPSMMFVKLAELVLVLVPGSVEEERTFTMGFIKDRLRNRLGEEHLNTAQDAAAIQPCHISFQGCHGCVGQRGDRAWTLLYGVVRHQTNNKDSLASCGHTVEQMFRRGCSDTF